MGITERDGDATLRGNGMGTGRENFREQRTGLSALGIIVVALVAYVLYGFVVVWGV
jgi:hypothetical protein